MGSLLAKVRKTEVLTGVLASVHKEFYKMTTINVSVYHMTVLNVV